MASSTDWNINSDIYDILSSVNNLKKSYVEDEDENTLATGIFGFISDTEAKKIQTSVILTGELGNEMFPTRAKLTKNIITHAIYSNIENIEAVPARMTVNLGIPVNDFDTYAINDIFTIDRESPITIGDYEFHTDYDIKIKRIPNGIKSGSDSTNTLYAYSAQYDITDENVNNLSNITEPYLKQPFTIRIGNNNYIIIQCTVRQYKIETTTDVITSDSILENKTFTFEFSDQLAEFEVYCEDSGKKTRIYPYQYAANVGDNIENYCWYTYISDSTVRITFDSLSYMPGLNTNITIRAYVTSGYEGNFDYTKLDEDLEGIYVALSSDKYNYSTIKSYMVASSNSENGTDAKTKKELQKLIPKAILSRGSITTETDINNYFNLLDDETNRLIMQKKVDNQLSRIWYSYFVLKDKMNNLMPANSIDITIYQGDGSLQLENDGRYVLPAGTYIKYDPKTLTGTVCDESEIPAPYTDEYFNDEYYYYMTIYNIVINNDPLYSAFYLTTHNTNSFFVYKGVNTNSTIQFVANRCNFKRNLLSDQSVYRFTFKTAQSIALDFKLYYTTITKVENTDTYVTQIVNNMVAIVVLYKNSIPYRWKCAKLVSADDSSYIYNWELDLTTTNEFDSNNNIKIIDMHVAGYNSKTTNYAYMDESCKCRVYFMYKSDTYKEFTYRGNPDDEYTIDDIAPGYENYTLANIYEVAQDVIFYNNFTDILNCKITANSYINSMNNKASLYTVYKVPVIGSQFLTSENNADYIVSSILEKKAYIDYCLKLLENSMNVDFKLINTYGPALTYTTGDDGDNAIGHIDLELSFRVSLKSLSDDSTINAIKDSIKSYIEDLYNNMDIHIPNLITYLTDLYSDKINYIQFLGFNKFDGTVQHIDEIDNIDDPSTVPEFLNIRNKIDASGTSLIPCINIITA